MTAKSEQIENLILENKKVLGSKEDEINRLSDIIDQIKKDHANELREIEKRWKNIIDQKTVQLEARHELEVNELAQEWQNERKVRYFAQQCHKFLFLLLLILCFSRFFMIIFRMI